MSDELKLRKQAEKAAQAKALLDAPILKEAFATFETDLMTVWANTPMAATDERERIWLAIKTAKAVQRSLEMVAADGKLAQRQLDVLLGRPKAA